MCRKLRDFTKEEMREIATEYANVFGIVKRDLARSYNTTVDVISNIFSNCFKKHIVNSDIAVKIAKKAITNSAKYGAGERTKKYYSSLLLVYYDIELEDFIYPVNYPYTHALSTEEKNRYQASLDELKSKAQSWEDNYISDDEDCPNTEQLLEEIEYLEAILA